MLKERIYQCADECLLSGEFPSLEQVAAASETDIELVKEHFAAWQETLTDRLAWAQSSVRVPDVPDVLNAAFSRLWQQAVEEANLRLALEQRSVGANIEEARRVSDDAIKEMQLRQQELENRIREQNSRIEALNVQKKSLEAEVSVLKTGLASETTQRKQEEQLRSNIEHELNHLRKTYEDSKRTFDQRIKDEQRHSLETVSKAEVDVRYYKNALEKLRDEVGKKESAMTREIHDLKAELAKRDVKLETYKTQVRTQEEELKQVKHESTQQSRELAKLTAALLSETNKSKRLEDRVKELEAERKRDSQKQLASTSDWSRRENALRTQLKEKEEEQMRLQSRVASLEKRLIAQDEEIRRLNAKL